MTAVYNLFLQTLIEWDISFALLILIPSIIQGFLFNHFCAHKLVSSINNATAEEKKRRKKIILYFWSIPLITISLVGLCLYAGKGDSIVYYIFLPYFFVLSQIVTMLLLKSIEVFKGNYWLQYGLYSLIIHLGIKFIFHHGLNIGIFEKIYIVCGSFLILLQLVFVIFFYEAFIGPKNDPVDWSQSNN